MNCWRLHAVDRAQTDNTVRTLVSNFFELRFAWALDELIAA